MERHRTTKAEERLQRVFAITSPISVKFLDVTSIRWRTFYSIRLLDDAVLRELRLPSSLWLVFRQEDEGEWLQRPREQPSTRLYP